MNAPINRIVIIALMFIICLFQSGVSYGEYKETSQEPLKIGFSAKFLNDVSRADAQVALELWIRELSKNRKLKVQPKPIVFDNVQEMTNALKNREVDLIALNTLDYLKIRDIVPLEPALVGNRGKNDVGGDEIVVVVRRDKGITNFSQLRGKKIIMHSGILIDTALLWLQSIAAQENLPARERFFGSIQEVKKASQSVLPVFFKQADAGLLAKASFETMIELNPQLGKELMVLVSSEKLLYGLFCFRKDLSADVKTEIIQNALNIKNTPAGRQIFTLFQIDNLTHFNPSFLNTTFALLGDKSHSKGKGLGRKSN